MIFTIIKAVSHGCKSCIHKKKEEKRFNMEDPPVHDTPPLDTGLSSFLYSYSFVFHRSGCLLGVYAELKSEVALTMLKTADPLGVSPCSPAKI